MSSKNSKTQLMFQNKKNKIWLKNNLLAPMRPTAYCHKTSHKVIALTQRRKTNKQKARKYQRRLEQELESWTWIQNGLPQNKLNIGSFMFIIKLPIHMRKYPGFSGKETPSTRQWPNISESNPVSVKARIKTWRKNSLIPIMEMMF